MHWTQWSRWKKFGSIGFIIGVIGGTLYGLSYESYSTGDETLILFISALVGGVIVALLGIIFSFMVSLLLRITRPMFENMRKYKVAGTLSAIFFIVTLWNIIALIKTYGFSLASSFVSLIVLLILAILYFSFSETNRSKITDVSVYVFFVYAVLRWIFSHIVVIFILSQYSFTKPLIVIIGFLPYIALILLLLGYGRTKSVLKI